MSLLLAIIERFVVKIYKLLKNKCIHVNILLSFVCDIIISY